MEKLEKLKRLREKTNMSVSECNKALLESNFDLQKACELLQNRMQFLAEKKKSRTAKSGVFGTYFHKGGALLGVVELLSETDFVAKNIKFKELAQDLAAQVLFSNDIKYVSESSIPDNEKSLYSEENLNKILLIRQPFYKDENLKIGLLLNNFSAMFGENIVIANFYKFEIK